MNIISDGGKSMYYFFPNKIKERQLGTPGETTIQKNSHTSMKESKNSIYLDTH